MKGTFINLRAIHKLMDKDRSKPFSIVYHSVSSGERISITEAICTSFHYKGRTMNIKNLVNGDIRTVKTISIIEFNGKEVII